MLSKVIVLQPENKVRLSEKIIQRTAKVSQSTRRPTRSFSFVFCDRLVRLKPNIQCRSRNEKFSVFDRFGKVISVSGDLYRSPSACPVYLCVKRTSTVTETTLFPTLTWVRRTQFCAPCGNPCFRCTRAGRRWKVANCQLEIVRVENDTNCPSMFRTFGILNNILHNDNLPTKFYEIIDRLIGRMIPSVRRLVAIAVCCVDGITASTVSRFFLNWYKTETRVI